MKSHKVWNLERERRDQEEKLQKESTSLDRKEENLQNRKRKENNLLHDKNLLEETIGKREDKLNDMLLDLGNDAEEASFLETHEQNKHDFKRHQHDRFDFSVWSKETSNHIASLETIEEELRTFDHLKARHQEKDKDLADEKKLLDDITYQEQEWTRLFEEDKEQKLNEIHTWLEETESLKLQDDVLQETSRAIHSLYEPTSYDTIKHPFREAIYDYQQQQREKLSLLRVEKEQLIEELARKEQELKEWKLTKDPEPETDPLTKAARQQLEAANVQYVPFYAAVEFHDHVDVEVRKRIEAALLDTGTLNSLITDADIQVEHDRLLRPAPNMMAYTLADYLKPDLDAESNISVSLVDDVLRSITLEDQGAATFSIDEAGRYQIGLLQGHALPVVDVRYIGRNARKRFREEQIALLQDEIAALRAEERLIASKMDEVNAAIEVANSRLTQFPTDDDLQESFRQIADARLKIDHHKKQVKKLSDELKTIYSEYTKVKHAISEKSRSYNLEVTLVSYQEAIAVMKRYDKDLSALEKEHIHYVNDCNRQQDIGLRLEELEQEIIEIQGEIYSVRDLVRELKQTIEQIEQQLEQQGVVDIREQISKVQQALTEIEQKLDMKKVTLPRKETEKDHVKESLEMKREDVLFWTNMKETWEASFKQELGRGFIEQDSELAIEEVAREVRKEFGHLLKEADRSKLTTQLSQEFYKQLSDLMEHRPNIYNAPYQMPAWMKENVSEEQKPQIEQWKQLTSRQLIELNYHGKQVNPYTVQQQIELEQARQESFLNEQDQALYEEILFQSVGQKLRARIRRAEQWVSKMKHLMETRNTSSGLSFSIKWKPRTADAETEMDTIDLVHLLRQDPKLLKEEDLEKITTHFRSKITKAKELIGDSSEMQTLLQVLKEVLDYRKWFSFVLYFQREGEKKRELNNNQFYKFSGGEKAMAMYIPLFTACYSRYSEADPVAPYIISLDEAFAGVDENNIREMFEIVEQLGFNYIMNSQVLWGDYDTISELSISELVRPKNADFVSVIRYHWDGNKMDVELPNSEENGAQESLFAIENESLV